MSKPHSVVCFQKRVRLTSSASTRGHGCARLFLLLQRRFSGGSYATRISTNVVHRVRNSTQEGGASLDVPSKDTTKTTCTSERCLSTLPVVSAFP